jgi:hypothetical protein
MNGSATDSEQSKAFDRSIIAKTTTNFTLLHLEFGGSTQANSRYVSLFFRTSSPITSVAARAASEEIVRRLALVDHRAILQFSPAPWFPSGFPYLNPWFLRMRDDRADMPQVVRCYVAPQSVIECHAQETRSETMSR